MIPEWTKEFDLPSKSKSYSRARDSILLDAIVTARTEPGRWISYSRRKPWYAQGHRYRTTDYTFADENDSAGNSLSTWNIYHVTAGASLMIRSMKLTMGGAYSFGSDTRSITTLIVPPGGGPPVLTPEPLDVKYHRLRVLVGFDFGH